MYHFRTNAATRYGARAAIIAQQLWDTLEAARENGDAIIRHEKEWTRCSAFTLTRIFLFYSRHQIADSLDLLVENHVIIKKAISDDLFDHTNWYAFTETGERLMRGGVEDRE